jgi:hypothetical protein
VSAGNAKPGGPNGSPGFLSLLQSALRSEAWNVTAAANGYRPSANGYIRYK